MVSEVKICTCPSVLKLLLLMQDVSGANAAHHFHCAPLRSRPGVLPQLCKGGVLIRGQVPVEQLPHSIFTHCTKSMLAIQHSLNAALHLLGGQGIA